MGNSDLGVKTLSDYVIFDKYAKYKPEESRRESFDEIVERNKAMHVETIQRSVLDIGTRLELLQDLEKACEMVKELKILPSMRAMQFGGKPIDINPARSYNCSYLPIDSLRAFDETMFLLLGGSGVGFSVQEHHIKKLPKIKDFKRDEDGSIIYKRHLVGDSIEGWSYATRVLIKSYFNGGPKIKMDFRDIRPQGSRLKTTGGIAPGPEGLKQAFIKIEKLLSSKKFGDRLKPIDCHDIQCFIASAVLSGGIRRSAMISLFDRTDKEMIKCKSGHNWWADEMTQDRAYANNSAVMVRGKVTKSQFKKFMRLVEDSGSGDPGVFWTWSRDLGTNPCAEILLRAFQFCNLVEINGSNIENEADFRERLKYVTLLGTLQASLTDFHYLRPIWKKTTEEGALIGVGITGIADNKLETFDLSLGAELVKEHNAYYAKTLGINPSARCTTVKPSGTTSCVLGTSSGIHEWYAKHYIRRATVQKSSPVYKYLKGNIPELLEDKKGKEDVQAFITFPCRAPEGSIVAGDESPLEFLKRVAKYNNEWVRPGHRYVYGTDSIVSRNSANNVSATVYVKSDEWGEVVEWMWDNRNDYNGLSVFPFFGGVHGQTPFQKIEEERYKELVGHLKELDFTKVVEEEDLTHHNAELACAGGSCEGGL